MTQRAIVTGGAGFIGSHLVDALVGRGWRVLVVDDLSNPVSGYWNPEALYLESSVQRAIVPDDPVDAVFHLAGKVGPTGVLRWSGQIAKDTIDAAATSGAWARRAECPLIDISTSEVYGSPAGPNHEETPRVFGPTASARTEYAVSKLAAETMLLNTRDLDIRIVRPFNVTGPRQLPDGGFVLPRFVTQALARRPMTVYLPGTQRRAFAHVSDIVSGILAVHDRGRAGEVYNLGNPDNECSIIDLAADVMAATMSRSGFDVVDPATLHGPAFREAPDKIPAIAKATRELGWQPRWPRSMIVEDVVRYWRDRA
jgi:nucleoside-diphosphate-sugar epimerase